MGNKLIICVIILVIFSTQVISQEYQQLLDNKTRDLLHEVLSGELAKEHVIAISRYHRIQGSRGYRESAHYVIEQLKSNGFSNEDAYVESFKSDGKIEYGF